jgi:hypothetical protein
MKKLLFVAAIGFGAAMLVKTGQVSVTQDKQIQVAGYNVPLPDAVQNSPLMGIVLAQLPEAASRAGASPAAAPRPLLPIVNSANGTFNANTPASASASYSGPAAGADGLSTAAKALRGSQ